MEAGKLYNTIFQSLGSDQEKAVGALQSPFDAIAVAVHAWALHSGLRYDGFSDADTNDNKSQTKDTFDLSNISPLEATWQRGSPNFFSFRYSSQNGLPVDITVSRLGEELAVNGLMGKNSGSSNVDPGSIINRAFFQRPDGSEEIRDAYASDASLEAMCQKLTTEVYEKLLPSGSASTNATKNSTPVQNTVPLKDPPMEDYSRSSTPNVNMPNSRPFTPNFPVPAMPRDAPPIQPDGPPGFEDEYEMNAANQPQQQPRPFAPFGDQDLYPPVGNNPPIQPYMPGGNMGGPNSGGMHPTFDDPLFQGQGQQPQGQNLMRPPGARWDPTGPTDNRFGGLGRGNGMGGPGSGFI